MPRRRYSPAGSPHQPLFSPTAEMPQTSGGTAVAAHRGTRNPNATNERERPRTSRPGRPRYRAPEAPTRSTPRVRMINARLERRTASSKRSRCVSGRDQTRASAAAAVARRRTGKGRRILLAPGRSEDLDRACERLSGHRLCASLLACARACRRRRARKRGCRKRRVRHSGSEATGAVIGREPAVSLVDTAVSRHSDHRYRLRSQRSPATTLQFQARTACLRARAGQPHARHRSRRHGTCRDSRRSGPFPVSSRCMAANR